MRWGPTPSACAFAPYGARHWLHRLSTQCTARSLIQSHRDPCLRPLRRSALVAPTFHSVQRSVPNPTSPRPVPLPLTALGIGCIDVPLRARSAHAALGL